MDAWTLPEGKEKKGQVAGGGKLWAKLMGVVAVKQIGLRFKMV